MACVCNVFFLCHDQVSDSFILVFSSDVSKIRASNSHGLTIYLGSLGTY